MTQIRRMTLRQQTFLFSIGKRGFDVKNQDEYGLVLQAQKILNRKLNHNTLNTQIKCEKHRIDKVRADAVFSERLIVYKRMNTLTRVQHNNLDKANIIISGWLSMLNPELEAIINSTPRLRFATDKDNCLQKLQDRAFGFVFSYKPKMIMSNYVRGSIYLKKLSLFTQKDRSLYGLHDVELDLDYASRFTHSVITPDCIEVIAVKLNTTNRSELKQYKEELLAYIA
jgi:hypothetical protein